MWFQVQEILQSSIGEEAWAVWKTWNSLPLLLCAAVLETIDALLAILRDVEDLKQGSASTPQKTRRFW